MKKPSTSLVLVLSMILVLIAEILFRWVPPLLRSQSAAHPGPPPQLVQLLGQKPEQADGHGKGGGGRHRAAGVRDRDGGLQPNGEQSGIGDIP